MYCIVKGQYKERGEKKKNTNTGITLREKLCCGWYAELLIVLVLMG